MPLTDALWGGQQAKLTWTAEMAAAFQQSKSSIFPGSGCL
jgi:hypothetical protein